MFTYRYRPSMLDRGKNTTQKSLAASFPRRAWTIVGALLCVALAWLFLRVEAEPQRAPIATETVKTSATFAEPAATGRQARYRFRAELPELVLLDLSLAEMESALRAQGYRVILVGGPSALSDAARQIAQGARFGAIHIVSHGTPGRFSLDGAQFSVASLDADPSGLMALARHLADGGDILLYGCESAKGDEGRALMAAIAARTSADVAGATMITGLGHWALDRRRGIVTAQPITLPHPVRLWTNELFEGGWFGDTNVPAGATAPHPRAGQRGSGRLSTMGDNQGGPGVTFSVQPLFCCSAQTISNAGSTSYDAAVAANDYFFSNIVVGGSNGATITRFQYNQVVNNTIGAQFRLALFDTVTSTLTPITDPLSVSGPTPSIQISTTRVAMVAGRTYQLRIYGFNCGGSAVCYIDNPQIWTQANEAPVAVNDNFNSGQTTTVTGDLGANDTDPEGQARTVTAINGAAYTVGSPIALANGTLRITANTGAFTFTPTTGFFGSQAFTYTISDGLGGTSTATATITINQVDLALTQSAANAFVLQSATQTFTLTVTSNASSSMTASGIAVRVTLPAGFTFSGSSGTGTFDAGTGVWTIGNLAVGASTSRTITGTVTASPRSVLTSTAEITASAIFDPDSTPNNGVTTEDDYAQASFTVTDPSLTVTKTSMILADGVSITNFKAIPGAAVRYCILVTNTGNQTATDVIARDPIAAELIFVSGSVRSGGTCDTATANVTANFSGNVLTAPSVSLAPGQTYAITFQATIR